VSPSTLTAEQRSRVEKVRPLVERQARRMASRVIRISEEELRSVGYEALVRCVLRYEPGIGTSFATFSYHRTRGAMIDAARKAVPGLRQRSRAQRALETTQSLLEQTQRREETDGPDPRRLEQRVAVVEKLIAQATTAVILSGAGPKDPENLEGNTDLDNALDDARVRERLERALSRCCSKEERDLLRALYQDGLSMTELATKLGRSKSTVSRRHSGLIARLSRELASENLA